ncbi:putative (4S)-4-hydroxy-5-phosphonooxypentane-2,3-dione isomerase [Mesorhizobium ventifaucium]|uniref:(4S)-4-hydroxy-5-phosphonooxypentane-2,3-dione isomerase n=2 Tax=Mesorhizobium ventifaucium TaxID=666020 RepID=A0ABM9DWE8_9HYPH|nr:putative (4S)-4-hydroxy-5-phosphonooxypentane-2,3-dione isomerase [Mesorhizobium ventifaucium]
MLGGFRSSLMEPAAGAEWFQSFGRAAMQMRRVPKVIGMFKNRYYVKAVLLVGALIMGGEKSAVQAQERDETVVRVAELVIDPAQLDAYKAAVKEEMEDAIDLEPGVLAIYSVAEKDKPNSLRFFEVYASEEAYRAHIASPHFKKYVATTQSMILSRKLIETVPVQLSVKPR